MSGSLPNDYTIHNLSPPTNNSNSSHTSAHASNAINISSNNSSMVGGGGSGAGAGVVGGLSVNTYPAGLFSYVDMLHAAFSSSAGGLLTSAYSASNANSNNSTIGLSMPLLASSSSSLGAAQSSGGAVSASALTNALGSSSGVGSSSLASSSSANASSTLSYMSQLNLTFVVEPTASSRQQQQANRKRLESQILPKISHLFSLFSARTRIELVAIEMPENVVQVLANGLRLDMEEACFDTNWRQCMEKIANVKYKKQLSAYKLDEVLHELRYVKKSKVFILYSLKSHQYRLLVAA